MTAFPETHPHLKPRSGRRWARPLRMRKAVSAWPLGVVLGLVLLTGAATIGLAGPSTLTQALGLTALVAMAGALVLAARWRWVEVLAGGADRAYLAHRWFGYGAVTAMGLHWAIEADLNLRETGLGEAAEGAGEFAAFALVGLGAISLLRLVPYHIWKKSHYALGPVFLLGAFHAIFVPSALTGTAWQGLAWVAGVAGLLGWLGTLWVHLRPTRAYRVTARHPVPGGIDLRLEPIGKPLQSKPGQFADIGFDRAGLGEFHPFTLAGNDGHELRLIVRAAGGYTRAMVDRISVGDRAQLRPARGGFRPHVSPDRPEQVWLAGGVGITPFLAALATLQPDTAAPIHLIHVTRNHLDAIARNELAAHARRLPQLSVTWIEGRPDAQRLDAAFGPLAGDAQLFLCGPEGLKRLARDRWSATGQRGRIHDEAFDFRAAL